MMSPSGITVLRVLFQFFILNQLLICLIKSESTTSSTSNIFQRRRMQVCHSTFFKNLRSNCTTLYNRASYNDWNRRSEIVGVLEKSDNGDFISHQLPKILVEKCCKRPCTRTDLAIYCNQVHRTRTLAAQNLIQRDLVTDISFAPSVSSSGNEPTTSRAEGVLESVTEIDFPDPVPIGDQFSYNYIYIK